MSCKTVDHNCIFCTVSCLWPYLFQHMYGGLQLAVGSRLLDHSNLKLFWFQFVYTLKRTGSALVFINVIYRRHPRASPSHDMSYATQIFVVHKLRNDLACDPNLSIGCMHHLSRAGPHQRDHRHTSLGFFRYARWWASARCRPAYLSYVPAGRECWASCAVAFDLKKMRWFGL